MAKDIVLEVYTVVDSESELEGCNFQRFRVVIDVSKPICRGQKITLHSRKYCWISFKYKRLPNIYYWCRKLTHFDRECPTWLKSKGSLKDGDNSLSPGYKHLPRIRLKN